MKIAVSYLASDNYKKCIEVLNNTKTDFIHVDLCDGKYVETKNFTLKNVISLLKSSKKKLNIHLMVIDPKKYIDSLATLNVDEIIIHNVNGAQNLINYIKSLGIKAGIAINPNEKITDFEKYFDMVDTILVMSVMPGKGGQTFIKDVLQTIDYLNSIKNNYNFDIAVDGGINSETINFVKDKVDLVISGSFITKSDDYDKQISILK